MSRLTHACSQPVDLRLAATSRATPSRHSLMGRDCYDQLTAHTMPGRPIHVQVGTIVRSEQSALTKDGPIKATSGTSQQPSLQAAMTNTWAE